LATKKASAMKHKPMIIIPAGLNMINAPIEIKAMPPINKKMSSHENNFLI